MTGYELLSSKPVAPNGPQWHELRNSIFEFPEAVPQEVSQALTAMMATLPAQRPTAAECLQQCTFLQSPVEQEVKYLKQRVANLEEHVNPLYHR